ncbi:MAG: YggT family protein [Candidatus Gastranaerophilales bacterium]|nr:YggT family protein [Candidatus Gastranaerophilales bacterium]
MISIHQAIAQLFDLIQLILIIRILLGWFPNINWWNQPFKLLHDVTEPILAPFRRIIPPIGGLDLSPIVAFLALGILQSIVLTFV